MLDEPSARIAAVKHRLARRAELADALPKTRETLDEERYQLAQLEGALEHVDAEIDALRSFTLQYLWDGILGRTQGKLDRLGEERAALVAKCEESRQKVDSDEQTVATLEQQLADLGDPDAELRALLDQHQQRVLDRQDQTAETLHAVLNDLDRARTVRQKLNKAVQSAKHATERLHSLTKAIGRANTRNIGTRPAGVLGAAVVNTVLRSGSQPAVNRARDGLVQLGQVLTRIELDAHSELDAEIARLVGVVTQSEASLRGAIPSLGSGNMGVTLPAIEAVQTLLGHLDTKLDQASTAVKDLEHQRNDILQASLNEPAPSTAAHS
jgi:hypothetical protein